MKQLALNIKTWGGKRKGAGRKNRKQEGAHKKRPKISKNYPMHLTVRVKDGVPYLKSEYFLKLLRRSILASREFGLNVLHFSLQANHIHIIVEANDIKTLASGMKSFNGRMARGSRRKLEVKAQRESSMQRKGWLLMVLKGKIISGRYHLHQLKTPSEMKRALKYVLFNTAKHDYMELLLDIYSSAGTFWQLPKLLGKGFRGRITRHVREREQKQVVGEWIEILSPPQSWLAREGWARAG